MNPTPIYVEDAAEPDWQMPSMLREQTRAFAEAVFRSETSLPPEDRIEWLLGEVEDFLRRAGGRTRLVFTASMTAVSTLAPAIAGKLPPLSRLTTLERVHAIEAFEQTPLGMAVLGAKATVCILWYEHPDTMREVRIDTECLV